MRTRIVAAVWAVAIVVILRSAAAAGPSWAATAIEPMLGDPADAWDEADEADDETATADDDEFDGTDLPLHAVSLESSLDSQPGYGAAPAKPAGKKKPAGPPSPYKGVYYDNDFSYLDKPNNKYHAFGDAWKRLEATDCSVLDLGGEFRLRYHLEHNLRGSNLTGRSDEFLLERTRLYANWEYDGFVRLYAEAIDANSDFEHFTPRTIEENRFDALNLFGDLLLTEDDGSKLWGRVGRQELLYGNERLVSPLDWSNTRRTFDGAKIFWRGEDWNVDGYWVRPVPFAQHVNSDVNFDAPDQSQEFMSLYATFKGIKDKTLDLYYFRYAEYNGPGTFFAPQDFNLNLFGGRWLAKSGDWLGELEGGYQFGEWGATNQSAGFFTAGLGRQFPDACWKPKLWLYYDFASGDANPNDGEHGTFNQLFPLGHKYFGYCDLVGRQNIHDLNLQLTTTPHKKLTFMVWYHIFHLDEARDALYNANGTAIRVDNTGAAGTDVGQELDLTLTWNVRPRADLLFGYSHFYQGDFVRATNPVGVNGDVDFFYTQFNWRF